MAVTKTRKLTDLFRVGTEFTVDDGDGGVLVYLAKLNPVQSETAIRKANAARARFLTIAKDKESDQYLAVVNDVMDLSKDELLDYVSADEMARRSSALEAEYAENKDWMKDDYLQGLFDAWEDGLQDLYLEAETDEERDPEAVRVFSEMQKYSTEVNDFLAKEGESVREDFANKPMESLQELIVEKMLRIQADLGWMIEYRKCEVWLGTYTSTQPRKPYFATRQEVDLLEAETLTCLIGGMSQLNVEVDEGKDLPLTEDSSVSSESLEKLETEDFSSLEEAVL